MLRFGDLCSGAGGMSQGLEDSGIRAVVAQDNWKPALDTYKLNFPNTLITNRDFAESSVYTVFNAMGDNNLDILVGSPPVEPSDEGRPTLLKVFSRIAVGVLPDVVVFEGPTQVFSGYPKHLYAMDLIDPLVSAGYRVKMERYDVADFGVPQHRQRALMIAARRRVPFMPEPADRHISVKEALSFHRDPEDRWSAPIPPTQTALRRIVHISQGNSFADLPEEVQYKFWKNKDNVKRDGGSPTYLRRLEEDKPSKAVSYRAFDQLIHPTEDRFLTVREAAVLQSFPINFRFSASMSASFKLIAQSTPPEFARRIGEAVIKTMESPRNSPGGGVESFLEGEMMPNSKMYRMRRCVRKKYGILSQDRWGKGAYD